MVKRIVSLVLALIILITITSVTVFARENYNKADKEYLFEDLIADTGFSYYYDELYYHRVDENDPESEIDWAIVYCDTFQGSPSGTARIVLDRVIVSVNLDMYYPVCWAVYDAETKEIISIDEIDVTKYEDFEQGLEIAKVGNPFGDANLDGVLNILDATYIQMVIAQLCDFEDGDRIAGYPWGVNYDRPLDYISDINGDGERNILDATAIQLKLAGLE